ncbi:MAG: 4Fe-4S dicluster domain-containing protein, partial [Candidatus Lokiarchaeota archaeon]|nr:4Fe-4S dicluster domain-containing protein [Candidatus Lokiarchaeota archaeon]MBD3202442.1 4Fe-4S dicluster domain-containing protein [Candidatus Lokiarchaeota archaeon]
MNQEENLDSEIQNGMITNSLITIDIENCTRCGACVDACPARLYYIQDDELKLARYFEDYCIECGHCTAICPVKVIKLNIHEDKTLIDTKEIQDIPSFQHFHNLVRKRRSIRQYKEEAVPKEKINKLLEIANYSPTASNTENVYFSVVKDKKTVSKISRTITKQVSQMIELAGSEKGRELLKSSLSQNAYEMAIENAPKSRRILKVIEQGTDFWCWNAPALIIIHGDREIGGISVNCSLAGGYIMLAAETIGLVTCSLGYLTYFVNQIKKLRTIL